MYTSRFLPGSFTCRWCLNDNCARDGSGAYRGRWRARLSLPSGPLSCVSLSSILCVSAPRDIETFSSSSVLAWRGGDSVNEILPRLTPSPRLPPRPFFPRPCRACFPDHLAPCGVSRTPGSCRPSDCWRWARTGLCGHPRRYPADVLLLDALVLRVLAGVLEPLHRDRGRAHAERAEDPVRRLPRGAYVCARLT